MSASDTSNLDEGAAQTSDVLHDSHLNAAVVVGGFLALGSMLLAAFGPLLAPYPPMEANPGQQLLPPSGAHWFGTDDVGMDVFCRVISAPRSTSGSRCPRRSLP